MGLDLSVNVEVGSIRLTHNLTKMADHVPSGSRNVYNNEHKDMRPKDVSLYDVLWRPDENGIYSSEDIIPHLNEALIYMEAHKDVLEEFSPPNGWGTYDGLLKAVRRMLRYCLITKDGYLRADR